MVTTSRARPGVLGEISLGNIQNIKPNIESLTRELDNFHIYESEKENYCQQRATIIHEDRPIFSGEATTLQAPSSAPDAECLIFCDSENALSATSEGNSAAD